MPGKTEIEWATDTWNPTTGCTKVSPGCAHCYAETFAERFRGVPGHPYEQGFDLRLWPSRLGVPLRWTSPRRIFVNSMSDLFHEQIPNQFIEAVFAVMTLAPRHTFQVLTKRPDRMAQLLRNPGFHINVLTARWEILGITEPAERGRFIANHPDHPIARACPWPLPNVWVGTSVENRRFIGRADLLRQTPAVVRFISAEPLLGPLLYDEMLDTDGHPAARVPGWRDGFDGPELDLTGIDWLIAGGESGGHARPLRVEWVDALANAARQHGAALFVKQLGARWAREHHASSRKGGDPNEWPARLRVREFPTPLISGGQSRAAAA